MNEADFQGTEERHEHPHHHQIHFSVEGEPVEVLSSNHEETELTVREVLEISGNKPASDFWLVEYIGEGHKHREEFKDLDQRIKVRNHSRFSAVCTKPNPLS
jgi:hypothetical protein